MGTEFEKDKTPASSVTENADDKIAATEKVCMEYISANYDADEIKIAEEIFRLALKDSEVKIRATMAKALKEAENLPHDIAKSLADDVDEVANPIIEHSPVLTDEDLLSILNNSDMQKIIAISRRKNLTKDIVKQLLDKSDDSVNKNIITHSEFANSEEGFEEIITSLASNRKALKEVIGSISLPPKLTETMMQKVASDMIERVKEKYDFTPGLLDKVAGHTIELSTLTIINEKSQPEEVDALIDHLHDFDRLTTSLILSSLCVCKIRFFISSLSKRSGIKKSEIRKILEEGSKEGIGGLLTKADMPEKLQASIRIVLKFIIKQRNDNPKMTTRECSLALIEELEDHYRDNKVEYLNYLLTIAKQNLKTPIFGSL